MHTNNKMQTKEFFMRFVDANNNIVISGVLADYGFDHYLSVFNFINHACVKKPSSIYGRNLFNRLISAGSDHISELLSFFKNHQLLLIAKRVHLSFRCVSERSPNNVLPRNPSATLGDF